MTQRNRRGLAILTFAMASAAIIPLFGTALDGAMFCVVKQRLAAAVESASRAASKPGANSDSAARRFLDANFPEGFLGTSHRVIQLKKGRIEVSVDAPAYFLQLIHVSSVRVSAISEWKQSEPPPEVDN